MAPLLPSSSPAPSRGASLAPCFYLPVLHRTFTRRYGPYFVNPYEVRPFGTPLLFRVEMEEELEGGPEGGVEDEGAQGRGWERKTLTGLELYETIHSKMCRLLHGWPPPTLSIPPEERMETTAAELGTGSALPPPRSPPPALKTSSITEESVCGGEIPRPWGFRLRLVTTEGSTCCRCAWKEVGAAREESGKGGAERERDSDKEGINT